MINKLKNLINNLNGIHSPAIEKVYDEIANFIFQYSKILVNDSEFLFREIEFYYYEEGKHLDMFTHKNIVQKEVLKWYFHDAGIDITIGNNNGYGGILIRSILNNNTKEFIDGPLNSFDKLFSFQKNVTEQNCIQFKTFNEPNYDNINIIKTPRVGLYFKEEFSVDHNNKRYFEIEKQKEHIVRKFRYVVFDTNNPKFITEKNKFVLAISAFEQLNEKEHKLFVKTLRIDQNTFDNYKKIFENAKMKSTNFQEIDKTWYGKKLSEKDIIELMAHW